MLSTGFVSLLFICFVQGKHSQTLLARQDQPTACGPSSSSGQAACGMDLCCSKSGWCGWTGDYCNTSSCQEDFGRCGTEPLPVPPVCDPAERRAEGRSVGYYRGAALRSTTCTPVLPRDIELSRYTHLFWAFAHFEPASNYTLVPAELEDLVYYPAFTDLNVKTWISIGGSEVNNSAWSSMVSSQASRQAFITGVVSFLVTHNFTGIDIDWEYPVTPERNGHPDDMRNLVQLLAEMRACPSFGSRFGISVALPADFGYLQYFQAKKLLEHADFVGVMLYDLHSTKDANNVVAGQTDIEDISQDLMPLWYVLDEGDMHKVNFGLALYGRGYTLSDPECNQANGQCRWSNGSKPGPCTREEGLLSNAEIADLIAEERLRPEPLGSGNSTMKQITWNNQWMGFDDGETIQQKVYWASSHCFGGTMAWSVDLDVRTGVLI